MIITGLMLCPAADRVRLRDDQPGSGAFIPIQAGNDAACAVAQAVFAANI